MKMIRCSMIGQWDETLQQMIAEFQNKQCYREYEILLPIHMEEALYAIRNRKLDIVFIFIRNEQGMEIDSYHKLILEFPHTFFIFVSQNCTFYNARKIFCMGAFDCLQYPLKKEELISCLERVRERYYGQYHVTVLSEKRRVFVDHLFQAGDHIEEMCRDVLQTIYQDTERDVTEKQIIANNVKEKIYLEIISRRNWMEKFLCEKKFLYDQEFQMKNQMVLLKEWTSDFKEVEDLIQKYKIVDNKLITNIGTYVITHIDERMTLDDLSEHVYLNKSYISHIFKKVSGISLSDFIAKAKVDRAKILLADTDRKICEIAEQIGYSDVEYFRKKFRDTTGITPTEFRRNLRTMELPA